MIYANGLKLLDEDDLPARWNLFQNTASFIGSDWIFDNSIGAYIDTKVKAINGNVTTHQDAWTQVIKTFSVVKNKYYVFSLDITSKSNGIYIRNTSNVDAQTANLIKVISNYMLPTSNESWQRQVTVFYTLESFEAKFFTSGPDNCNVANFKLEQGTVPTSWMPAITDLALKSDLGGKSPL